MYTDLHILYFIGSIITSCAIGHKTNDETYGWFGNDKQGFHGNNIQLCYRTRLSRKQLAKFE